MTIVHDFEEELEWSARASCEPFWDAVYRKAFPNLVSHMPCPGDTVSQRQGIDRVVLLASGRLLRIDEKKRRKDYDDFLLEFVSVDTTGAPGWIEKDLPIDYLAYAFMPSRRCFLLPWDLLRRAWQRYGNDWKGRYCHRYAQNNGYRTVSVAVPILTVRKAVATASEIDVSRELWGTYFPE